MVEFGGSGGSTARSVQAGDISWDSAVRDISWDAAAGDISWDVAAGDISWDLAPAHPGA